MHDELRPKAKFSGRFFRKARTFSYWRQRPVSEALVETAFELACLGPTSIDHQPWRLVLVAARGQGAALTLRLVGQLREGADRADHRDRRL